MRASNGPDLEQGVFTHRSARAIALSLKRSALASQRRTLEHAKGELRKVFGRSP
jgi:hypothetical protein